MKDFEVDVATINSHSKIYLRIEVRIEKVIGFWNWEKDLDCPLAPIVYWT